MRFNRLWLVRQCRSEYEWECRRADIIHRHMVTNVYRTEGGTIKLGKSTPGMLEAEIDGYPCRLLRPPLKDLRTLEPLPKDLRTLEPLPKETPHAL